MTRLVTFSRKTGTSTVRQGGISDGVWFNSFLRKYASSDSPGGYVGSSDRTKDSDRIVERRLREAGLSDEGVAVWMTSTSGRHLGDQLDSPRFDEHAREYAGRALLELRKWGCIFRVSSEVERVVL